MSIHHDRILEAAARDLRIGAEVVTSDGEALGEIAEVVGTFARITRPMRRDVWLGAEYLLLDGERYCTSFARSDLGAYQRSGPDAGTIEDSTAAAGSSYVLLAEDEQQHQRIQMEAELASQRRHLPHEHPFGEGAPPNTGGTIGETVESELARTDPFLLEAALRPDAASGERRSALRPKRWMWWLLPAAGSIALFYLWRRPGRSA